MASAIAVAEAQQRLEELLDRAERGEEIVIEREGHAPMQLVPRAAGPEGRRIFGQNLLGITYMAPDWDAPMTEEELQEWGM